MKIKVNFTVEVNGKVITAPSFINLYPFGFIQAGKAKEGYRKWELKDNRSRCGFQIEV